MDQRPDSMNRTVMEQVKTKGKHNSCERARSIDHHSMGRTIWSRGACRDRRCRALNFLMAALSTHLHPS